MRRLLGSPYVLTFAVLVLLGVLTWAVLDNAQRRVRTVPGPVVVAPPRTPLPDRVTEEQAKRATPQRGNAKVVGRRQTHPQTRHNSPSPAGRSPQAPSRRETPRTTPKPRPSRPAPSQPSQTAPPSTPPESRPPVDVKAPIAPVQVCTEHVGVNC